MLFQVVLASSLAKASHRAKPRVSVEDTALGQGDRQAYKVLAIVFTTKQPASDPSWDGTDLNQWVNA